MAAKAGIETDLIEICLEEVNGQTEKPNEQRKLSVAIAHHPKGERRTQNALPTAGNKKPSKEGHKRGSKKSQPQQRATLEELSSWEKDYEDILHLSRRRQDENDWMAEVEAFLIEKGELSEKKTRRSVRKTPPESTLESSPKENSKNIKRTHSDAKGFQKRFSVRHKQLSDQALVISPAVNALVNTLLKGREESIHVALAFIVNSRYNHHAVKVISTELLKRGADPNKEAGEDGQYPLHWAVYRREEELAELLIKSGAEVNKTDDQGEPPIFQAVRGGKKSENVFDLLLKYTNRVELNRITTKSQRSVLHEAVIYSNKHAIKALIGLDLNVLQCDGNLRIPHHWAVIHANVEILQLLIEHSYLEDSSVINSADIHRNTLLHYAVLFGHIEIFDFLMEFKELKCDCQNIVGKTPFHMACSLAQHGSDKSTYFAKKLLDNGIDFTVQDTQGRTPVHEIALLGTDYNILQMCISKVSQQDGCTLSYKHWIDKNGQTPFHDYLSHGWRNAEKEEDIIEWMDCIDSLVNDPSNIRELSNSFQRNSDLLCHKDKSGKTPLLLAVKNNLTELIDLLQGFTHQRSAPNSANSEAAAARYKRKFSSVLVEYFPRKSIPFILKPENAEGFFKMHKIMLQNQPSSLPSSPNCKQDQLRLVKMALEGEEKMEDSEISILVEELLELEDVQNANKALAILIGVHPGLSYDINQYSVQQIVLQLVSQGASIQGVQAEFGSQGSPILHQIIESGKKEDQSWLVEFLILHGCHINEQDGKGRTPLMVLLEKQGGNARPIIQVLLDYGANVNLVDLEGNTILHYATKESSAANFERIVFHLLTRGADPNLKNVYGKIPWSYKISTLKMLVHHGLASNAITSTDQTGKSFLHFAQTSLEVKYLVNLGIQPHRQDQIEKWSPLHEAVYNDRYQAVKGFCSLKNKMDYIDLTDSKGRTALHIASEHSHKEIMEELLRSGINAGITNDAGQTALDLFIKSTTKIKKETLLTILNNTFLKSLPSFITKEDGGSAGEMSKATTLLDLFCDERFNGSSQGMDDILVESLHPPNDESPNYRKAVRTIKAISSLGLINMFTENKLNLKDCLGKDKELTNAVLDKFVVGNKIVRCDVLDTDYQPNHKKERYIPFFSFLPFFFLWSILSIPFKPIVYIIRRCSKSSSRNGPDQEPEEMTCIYKMTADDKTIASHPAVQKLLDYKWHSAFVHHSILFLFYLLRMVNFATALMIAARPDLVNPGCYVNAWDSARFVFDIISCIFFIWKLLDEVQEMISDIRTYIYDTLNWVQLFSCLVPLLLVIPLRIVTIDCAHRLGCHENVTVISQATPSDLHDQYQSCHSAISWHWIFAAIAYILNALIIFEFMAVYKFFGVYLWAVYEILKKDISRFLGFFTILLYVFVGCFYLSLRSSFENGKHYPLETRYPWHVIFFGVRTLIEGEVLLDDYYAIDENGNYIGYSWEPIVIYFGFLFIVLVVLLNVLIAQMSKTYEDTAHDVNTKYYIALARTLARYRQSQVNLPHQTFLVMGNEKIQHFQELQEKNKVCPIESLRDDVIAMTSSIQALKSSVEMIKSSRSTDPKLTTEKEQGRRHFDMAGHSYKTEDTSLNQQSLLSDDEVFEH